MTIIFHMQPYLETSVIKSETANEESLQDN